MLGLAADMYYRDDIVAMIGPACTYALSPVARLAGYWNIPIVTGTGAPDVSYSVAKNFFSKFCVGITFSAK